MPPIGFLSAPIAAGESSQYAAGGGTPGWSGGVRFRMARDAARFGTNFLRGLFGGEGLAPDAPAVLLVGITSRCNLRCDFCFQAGTNIPESARRPKGFMSYERFAAIVDQARGWCTHLEFSLFGEPTLHPRFLDMVQLAVDAGLMVAIVTNGVLLDAERAEALVRIGPARVTVSMEGSTPAAYDRLRVGAEWQTVITNLRALVAAKRAAGRHCPFIVVRGIALDGHDQHAHAALYGGLGVDQVMWVPATNWSGSLRAPQGSVRVPPPLPRTQRCRFPRLQLGVDWDGTVVPCCVDFNAKNALGNVDVTPLQALWTGAALAVLRRSLATCDRQHIAATTGCDGCSYLSQPALPFDKKLQIVRMMIGEFRSRFRDVRPRTARLAPVRPEGACGGAVSGAQTAFGDDA